VAIDRVLALPRGIDFLRGQALRHVTHAELETFLHDWRRLVLGAQGAVGVALAIQPWLDRGGYDPDEVAEFVDTVGELGAQALESKQDLLLIGYPVP
jgi:hypothetical protein